jgi:hypothetical protein
MRNIFQTHGIYPNIFALQTANIIQGEAKVVKKVSFNSKVSVILITQICEYGDILKQLWYSNDDYRQFKQDVIQNRNYCLEA